MILGELQRQKFVSCDICILLWIKHVCLILVHEKYNGRWVMHVSYPSRSQTALHVVMCSYLDLCYSSWNATCMFVLNHSKVHVILRMIINFFFPHQLTCRTETINILQSDLADCQQQYAECFQQVN